MPFIEYFATVDRPFAEAEGRLEEVLRSLGLWAGESYRTGEDRTMQLGLGPIAKSVQVDVGTPTRSGDEWRVPLRWEATGARRLFPEMHADLTVEPLGEATIVTFRGSYEPPLAGLGRALDRTFLHRVAQLTVKDFVDRIAAAFEEA
ncbi:MAG TPA: hypothetical protein ENI86_14415 [Acidimicrobiales bacterium]|nr:hypothetical protein [Acidimicrobiales bacterium]